jgi:hypothetical protein
MKFIKYDSLPNIIFYVINHHDRNFQFKRSLVEVGVENIEIEQVMIENDVDNELCYIDKDGEILGTTQAYLPPYLRIEDLIGSNKWALYEVPIEKL